LLAKPATHNNAGRLEQEFDIAAGRPTACPEKTPTFFVANQKFLCHLCAEFVMGHHKNFQLDDFHQIG
jgi:hypothetical protein